MCEGKLLRTGSLILLAVLPFFSAAQGVSQAVNPPTAYPAPSTFQDSITVTLTADSVSHQIYYALGGSGTPATPYTSPIVLTKTDTIRAIALNNGSQASSEAAFAYTKVAGGQAPSITSSGSASGKVGAPFSYTITATGDPAPTFSTSTLPSGLSLSGAVISGTPTTPGTPAVTLTATNSAGNNSKTLTITIAEAETAPVITSGGSATAVVGTAFSYTLTATGNPPPTLTTGTLPGWLNFSPATGALTGTPSAAGTVQVNLTASNSVDSVSKMLTISITQKPVITSPLAVNAVAGSAFRYTVTASGEPAPVLNASTPLPGWLAYNAGTATLSGTPGNSDAGTASVHLTATNSAGTDAKTLAITVTIPQAIPVITSPLTASGTLGSPFTYTITASGTPAPSFGATGLPTGLALNATSGVISGTPTVTGTITSKITATNSAGSDSKELVFTLSPPLAKPSITSPMIASGTVGTTFTYTITATGYPAPTFTASPMPPGLTLSGAVISGTPTAAGTTTVTLTATNSQGSETKYLTVSIATPATKPAITSPLTAPATVGSTFLYTLTASGTPAPTLGTTGTLPGWLSFNSANGQLTGKPPGNAVGNVSVNLTATNSAGSDAKTLIITVSLPVIKPSITSAMTASAVVGQAFTYTITANGSTPITFTATPLPPGLSLNGAVISGNPSAAGLTIVKLTATNTAGDDNKNLIITVSAPAIPPVFTTEPPDSMVVLDGGKAVITVQATGTAPILYKWQVIKNNVVSDVITGGNQLSIDPVSPSYAGLYRAIASNAANPPDTSKLCKLVIKPVPKPIVITTQPVRQTVVVGKTVNLKVRATGEGTLLYQWFKNGTAMTPNGTAKDSNLVIASAALADAGLYQARVSNALTVLADPSTFALSDTARITVNLPKLDVPKATPTGQDFYPEVVVSLTDDTAGTTIRYTTNGSQPTENSTIYDEVVKIKLTASTTLKARAFKANFQPSNVMTETYSYTVPGKVSKPTAKPIASTFKTSLACTLATTTAGAAIRYTLDGTHPLTSATATAYSGPFTLKSTATVTAVATKAELITSDTLVKVYTLESIISKAATPSATPLGGDFTGEIRVALMSANDSATLYYTLDGTSPDTSKTRKQYSEPIILRQSTLLKAVATRNGMLNSDIMSEKYSLIPGPITAYPAGNSVFDDNVTVMLSVAPGNATLYYTLEDGARPLDANNKPTANALLYAASGIPLTSTKTITAMALLDGVASKPFSFSYTRKGTQLATPSVLTAGGAVTFQDSLKIVSISSLAGAAIHYTLNGGIPNANSPRFTTPFWIDTTVTLRAIALQKGYEDSKVLVAGFTLVPALPDATPGAGSYPTAQKVVLRSSSRKAKIYYTLNGDAPNPASSQLFKLQDTIRINATSTLKAMAVAGAAASPVLTANYAIFGVKDTILPPGGIYDLQVGGFSLINPEDRGISVSIHVSSADSLRLSGFKDVQYTLTLSTAPKDVAKGFPGLIFSRSASEKRSLYKAEKSGAIYYISGADTVTLSDPGIYFMGIDISPPVVTYLDESFGGDDSTEVSFEIKDNVTNLRYDIKRSDDIARNRSRQPLFGPDTLVIRLKNAPGPLKTLGLQLIVQDYQLSTFFPQGAFMSLAQKLSLGVQGPKVWSIGYNSLWDLVSMPVNFTPTVTLKAMQNHKSLSSLRAVTWDEPSENYLDLDPEAELEPGRAYWIASHTKLQAFSFPPAETKPQGMNKFAVKLKHGWNQVGNPGMERMYWPVPHANNEAYRSSPIKGLFAYTPRNENSDYSETDSLQAWRGYFVYNYLEDTTVELSPRPVISAPFLLQKRTTSRNREFNLVMGWGSASPLTLGAAPSASSGLGWEDERVLPKRGNRNGMRAIRQGHSLASDWIRLDGDSVLQWKVALEGTTAGNLPLKIMNLDLPEGYQAWAVSENRSMKFLLEAGKEIPPSGLPEETLWIYAGSPEQLDGAGVLRGKILQGPDLNVLISERPGSFLMHLCLPGTAKVRAVVWSLKGANMGDLHLGPLSGGRYRFAFDGDFQRHGQSLAPGMYFLTVDLLGQGVTSRIIRKIPVRD